MEDWRGELCWEALRFSELDAALFLFGRLAGVGKQQRERRGESQCHERARSSASPWAMVP